MEVDTSNQLQTVSMEDPVDMSDSDDCESVDEEFLRNQSAKVSVDAKPAEEDDYHSMKEVEYRLYQRELLELAKEQNIIVCLPTGSGKTYIALELTRHMLPEAIEKRQKIIFLANNVPLVNQQAKYFSQNLSSTTVKDDQVVRAITGDLSVDIWSQDQWDEVLSQCHIMVASTQIILDAITKGFIRWNQIALLILDECHHAQKKHPMAVLMRIYGERIAIKAFSHVPKVLGLTATIIKGQSKADRIPCDIEDIEKLLCCKAVTHRDYEEVLKNSTSTILKVKPYVTNFKTTDSVCQDINKLLDLIENLPKNFGTEDEISIVERINHPTLTSEEQIYNKGKDIPKSVKSFLADLLKTYEELGPYCCKIATTLKIVYLLQWIQELDLEIVTPVDDSDVTFQNSIFILVDRVKATLFQFKDKLDILMDRKANQASSPAFLSVEAFKIRYCVSNKIEELWKILESKRPSGITEEDKKNQLCGIIFCQRRIPAQVIRWYLEMASKEWPDLLGFIKPEMMIGQSAIVENTELARFTAKRQTQIVQKFHKRELNLLVATQVVEEGLNVPECNLVIRLDSINSYPSFIQALGRARKPGALCYALIDKENEEKENCKINGYVTYNKKLAETLEVNAIHVGDEDLDPRHYADLIPPFNPSGSPDGAIITSTEAVSLVHRYCSALSCDKIATLFPTAWCECSMKDDLKHFKARVLLPIISPSRDVVEGDWMPGKILAKRSAYLECCKRLWEAGELTENLLPKARSIENYKCQFLEDLKNELAEEKKTSVGAIGTKKRTQWYRKKEPAALTKSISDCAPMVYKLTIKMTKFFGEEKHTQLYEFDQFGLYYGIVTNSNLEGLPKFTLNASYGTFEVSIQQCKLNKQIISSSEILALEKFQVFLAEFAFNIISPVLVPNPQHSIMIAPLNQDPITKTLNIDWQLIQNLSKYENYFSEPSEQSRKDMKFNSQNYENKILIPWYKSQIKEKPELLCSIGVLDLNAQSPFVDPSKARTFEDFFHKNYGLSILHPTFPMINCKQVGKQMNFLTKKIDGNEIRKLKNTTLYMVPELVNVHIFPASMYVQGNFLPSILHRIYRLLLANEFRKSVAEYSKWEVNLNEDDISYGCDDEDMRVGLETVIEAAELDSVKHINTPSKEAEERKRKFVLFETSNPLTMDLDMIFNSIDSSQKKAKLTTHTGFTLPNPPTYKSDVCSNLVDVDEVKSYYFDKETDFSVERGPGINSIMEATTLINAQDSVNLEKLEIMGDSVLKLIVSLHIYRSCTTWDEGKMTQLRMRLICNLHMYQLGKKHELGEWLSGSIFIPNKSWLPTGFIIPKSVQDYVLSKEMDYSELSESELLNNEILRKFDHLPFEDTQTGIGKRDGKTPHTTFTHSHIGDKSVADCMEAIIGAYFVNGGLDGAFKIMDFIGMRGPLEDGNVTKYSRESTTSPVDTEIITKKQTIIPFLEDLETTLQYKFKNPWLAVEALTHPTYMGNRVTPCYERLEYVGDAILDFLVTNYILKELPKITDPGKITDLRSALVNNITFASLAVKYQFHSFLKYHSELLKNFIDQFVLYQQENDHKVSNQCKLLSDYDCPTVQEIDVPKVLGDVFESIAGAIYVDSMSIDTVWKVFYRLMKNELEEFSKKIPKSPLRELYELFPGKVKFSKPSSQDDKYTSLSPKYQIVYLEVPSSEKLIQAAAKYIVRKCKLCDYL